MKIGSLFSGYGGLDMAVQAHFGGTLAWYSEIEPAACRVMAAHHPGVPNLGDITTVNWADVEPVDILTGGYPCQPFSHAGKREGTNDERHLWPYVRDALDALRPMVAVFENVDGHRSLGLADVLGDLADLGMSARWGVVRAADAGAPHQRKRIFIVAYPSSNAWGERRGLPGIGRRQDEAQQVGVGDWGDVAYAATGRRLQRAPVTSASPDSGEHLATLADASGERHGSRQDVGVVGRVGAAADVSGRQASTTRQKPAHRGAEVAADAKGAGRVRAPQHEDDGADSGRGRRHDLADLGQGCGTFAPDSDVTGSQARGTQPHRARRGPSAGQGQPRGSDAEVSWGKYGPAITRWEHLTRPAPAPTITGATGRPRLNPAFVEWMMGLPDGHVTGHGLSNAQALKMLGNGVVPQQALLALSHLAPVEEVAA